MEDTGGLFGAFASKVGFTSGIYDWLSYCDSLFCSLIGSIIFKFGLLSIEFWECGVSRIRSIAIGQVLSFFNSREFLKI